MKFQSALESVLDFIWDTLVVIVCHPLFWLVVAVWVFWYIGTHPVEPTQYCPTCHKVL